MNHKYLLAGLVLAASLAGCDKRPSAFEEKGAAVDEKPAQVAQEPTPAAAVPDLDFVELPIDATATEPLPTAASESVQGEFVVPKAGILQGIEILVGNYSNSSVGELSAKVCQESVCSEGSADLAKSQDNQYFYIPLSAPLLTLGPEQKASYVFTRTSGGNNMAIWTYASADASSMVRPDGENMPRSPRLRLGYVK